MQGDLGRDQRTEGCQHLRVVDPGQPVDRIKPRDLQPQTSQRLSDLDADRTHADHGDAARQVGLLEQAVRGQDPVAETGPGPRHDRAATGGKNDGARLDLFAVDLHATGPQKPRTPRDGPAPQFVGHGLRSLDETVPHLSHPRQNGGDVGAHTVCATNAEFVERMAPVKGICSFDQRLGRHAADGSTGRAPVAVVDQQEIVGVATHLAQGGEACAARPDDHGVNLH